MLNQATPGFFKKRVQLTRERIVRDEVKANWVWGERQNLEGLVGHLGESLNKGETQFDFSLKAPINGLKRHFKV